MEQLSPYGFPPLIRKEGYNQMPSNISILVVDDDFNLLQSLSYLLKNAGYSVTVSGDPLEALCILKSDPFDLIFLDLKMPKMDGLALLIDIRKLYENVPIFILTAHATLTTAIEALRQGASDYFVKPFKPDGILKRVNEVSDKVRQIRRRYEIEDQIVSLSCELRSLDNANRAISQPELAQQIPLADRSRLLQRGSFVVDLHGQHAMLNNEWLKLSPTGFAYLEVLLRSSPEAVSYEDLVHEVQGYNISRSEARNIARWQIYKLRKVIEPDPENPRYVLNVRCYGYRLVTSA